jgi:uncharacterized protein
MAVRARGAVAVSCGVAVFVKTPALSPVKTRLWPGLGQQGAEALYMASAHAVASVAEAAQRAGGLQAYWAIAEDTPLPNDAWPGLPQLPQGSDSLGARMSHVYRQLRRRHRGAVLIGADAPQLVPAALTRAAHWLQSSEPRLAIGRAHDGGFWLFGGNADLPERAWLAPPYSAADTAECFVAAMQGHGRWLELETLHDLDTTADLPHVQAHLARLDAPTEAQQRLLAWLATQLALPCAVNPAG